MKVVQTRHRRTRRFAAALITAGLVLSACSNSGDDDASATDPEASSTETTVPADTEPEITASETTVPDTEPVDTAPTGSEPVATTPETTTPDTEPDIGTFEPIEGVPGVTDESISFAVLGTGAANPLGYCLLQCFQEGVQAFFDHQNSLGGVHGRELVIGRRVDDEFANTQTMALELISDNSIFGIFGAPLQYAGYSDIGESGIPLYTTFPAAVDSDGFDNIYLPTGTVCADCLSPLNVDAATTVGATKVASLGFGVSQASKDCVDRTEAEFLQWGSGAGVEFVYKKNDLPFGFPNGLGPEVTAMKEAGVDFISTCIDQNSVLLLEQELERQGIGDVVVALPQGYSDDEFVSANADLLEGDILAVPYRPIEADQGSSDIQVMLDAFEASGVVANDYAIQGYLGAQLPVAGLLAAGPQFDRASVVAATNEFTEWTAGGMIPPVDWSTAHTAPAEGEPYTYCTSFVRIVDGVFEMAIDPATPWHCFDVPMDAWTSPTVTDVE